MLNKRIIAIVVVKNNIVVQSFNFSNYLPIGSPEITLEYLNNWGIDEIIYLDIDATKLKSEPNYLKIKNSTKKCYVPITYGGGIRSLDQISKLMDCGIDTWYQSSLLAPLHYHPKPSRQKSPQMHCHKRE